MVSEVSTVRCIPDLCIGINCSYCNLDIKPKINLDFNDNQQVLKRKIFIFEKINTVSHGSSTKLDSIEDGNDNIDDRTFMRSDSYRNAKNQCEITSYSDIRICGPEVDESDDLCNNLNHELALSRAIKNEGVNPQPDGSGNGQSDNSNIVISVTEPTQAVIRSGSCTEAKMSENSRNSAHLEAKVSANQATSLECFDDHETLSTQQKIVTRSSSSLSKWAGMLTLRRLRKRRQKLASPVVRVNSASTSALDRFAVNRNSTVLLATSTEQFSTKPAPLCDTKSSNLMSSWSFRGSVLNATMRRAGRRRSRSVSNFKNVGVETAPPLKVNHVS